jgi:hypothetical protein
MAIRIVDHLYRRSHQAGELEERHTSIECEARLRVAHRVGREPFVEGGGFESWSPLTPSPVVEVDEPAPCGWEEKWRVNPRRQGINRRESTPSQRNVASRPRGLAVLLHSPVNDGSANLNHPTLAVHVSSLERRPLRRSQARLNSEDGDWPEGIAEQATRRMRLPLVWAEDLLQLPGPDFRASVSTARPLEGPDEATA